MNGRRALAVGLLIVGIAAILTLGIILALPRLAEEGHQPPAPRSAP